MNQMCRHNWRDVARFSFANEDSASIEYRQRDKADSFTSPGIIARGISSVPSVFVHIPII